MTVYAITDTKEGRKGIAPTHLQTTQSGDFPRESKLTGTTVYVW